MHNLGKKPKQNQTRSYEDMSCSRQGFCPHPSASPLTLITELMKLDFTKFWTYTGMQYPQLPPVPLIPPYPAERKETKRV